MSNNAYQVIVTVDAPTRTQTFLEQQLLKFEAAECVLTWSWGLQPATALIDWVSREAQGAIVPFADVTIELFERATQQVLHQFFGLCRSVVPVTSSDGRSVMQEFVDSRDFLQWDLVYGAWNMRESRIIDGRWKRRYWHILPADANRLVRTYTAAPYTAQQILDSMFGAATVESPWVRIYHPSLAVPVYEIDCLSGRKLGTAITEISERLGLVFTLYGQKYQLIWTLKGAGTIPDFPTTSNNRRRGTALSGNPTRVRILGDRNLYQVLDLELEPDWLPAWEHYWDLDYLADDLFQNEKTEGNIGTIAAGTAYKAIAGDAAQIIGRQLAAARARTITVGQYAKLRDTRGDGEGFRDYRKFAGKSRLQMPAALYIQNVLFRAFRPKRTFGIVNVDGRAVDGYSLALVDRGLVEVTHDPITGEMDWVTDVISAGNGYAIAQGYQVGIDGFKTLRPAAFRLQDWLGNQNVWQHLTFTTDDSGEGVKFIVFDMPVIQTADLIQQVGNYNGLKAGARVTAPSVRAALTFAAERFSYVAGLGARDAVENISGLSGEFVTSAVAGGVEELAYADGETASAKAAAIGAVLVNLQFTYDHGGWVDAVVRGQQLGPCLDRITLKHNSQGTSEEVDFTNERPRNVGVTRGGTYIAGVEPERDFDRRAQLLQLLPGTRELREEARQLQAAAAAYRANPRQMQTVIEAFTAAMGLDAPPTTVYIDPAFSPGALPALDLGTPMWRAQGSETALAHGDAVTADGSEVFMGVTVLHQERAGGPVRVTGSGDQGVIFARVQGPLPVGQAVGLGPTVQTYLVGANIETPNLQSVVGALLEDVGPGVALARVRVTGGGSGAEGLPIWL